MRRRLARLTLAWLISTSAALAPLSTSGVRAAQAQTDGDLRAARKLFTEAVRDEDEKRFDAALEKFRRVQQVKDTQPVRYRIATCLESLGKLRDAARAYEAALDKSLDGQTDDVSRAAREHHDSLSKRVARLLITLSPHAPADAQVRVDNEPLPAPSLGTPIPLDPGTHDVSATGTDAPPFRTSVTLPEGGQASITVMLEPGSTSTAITPPPPPPPDTSGPSAEEEARANRARQTWGIVGVAGAGVLVAGGVVLLLLRHGDIAELKKSCPSNACPYQREDELSSLRSRALLEGPLAVTLLAVGVVSAGIGAYLLSTPSDVHPTTTVAPFVVHQGGGLVLTRGF
jgi:hypothetical protein